MSAVAGKPVGEKGRPFLVREKASEERVPVSEWELTIWLKLETTHFTNPVAPTERLAQRPPSLVGGKAHT